MAYFDVFNGDADGICALHQLRLAQPRDATLLTGVKRDIQLLTRVDAAAGDQITVLDVSLSSNRAALLRLLARGVNVDYFDHHDADPIPQHPLLHAHIDQSAKVCTSLLVDSHLHQRYQRWALVAAYGDNLGEHADAIARAARIDRRTSSRLRELGEALNYNAYGDDESDLQIHPSELYRQLQPYVDPITFIENNPWFERLHLARAADLSSALACAPVLSSAHAVVFQLPDAPWSRRVRGALSNVLAVRSPQVAHAILTPNRSTGYVVSVRAPNASALSASEFASRFAGGGGRRRSAGINHLPADDIDRFCAEFVAFFQSTN